MTRSQRSKRISESLVLVIRDIQELDRDLELDDASVLLGVLDVTKLVVLLATGGVLGVASVVLADEVPTEDEDEDDVKDVSGLTRIVRIWDVKRVKGDVRGGLPRGGCCGVGTELSRTGWRASGPKRSQQGRWRSRSFSKTPAFG